MLRAFSALSAVLALGCATATPPARSLSPAETPAFRSTKPAPETLSPEKAELLRAIRASLTQPERVAVVEEQGPGTPIAPLVRPGTPGVGALPSDGSRLPPETIRRVLRQSAGRFRECYQRSQLRHGKLVGRMGVRFDIGPDGRVWRAEEENATLADRELRECILMRLFELEFPNPGRQAVTVRYPWSFGQSARPDELPSATRIAEPPPPGFEEAMRDGRPVRTESGPDVPESIPPAAASACDSGDPLCSDM